MFFDQKDIFDTPWLRYYQLKENFDSKYLNPKASNYEHNTKEIVQEDQLLRIKEFFRESEERGFGGF